MSVGVEELDSDHKAIIGLINRLHDSLQSGSEAVDLGEIFDGLIAYIEWHFAREEEIMEACGYPGFAEHRAEHVVFARYIFRARDSYRGGTNPAMARALLDYLWNWLERHILILDKAYRPYVVDNPTTSRLVERAVG
jgi:hemerythrin-like metal-binding protein